MIINLTDAEAFSWSKELQAKPLSGEFPQEGIEEGPTEVSIEALERGKAKLKAAMQKSDAKLSRRLNYAISSLESSGFDTVEIEALKGARDKAALHNDLKYESKKLK